MQGTAWLIPALALMVPAVAGLPLRFEPPAEFEAAQMHSQSVEWIFIVLREDAASEFSFHAPADTLWTNETLHEPLNVYRPSGTIDRPAPYTDHESARLDAPLGGELLYPAHRIATLYIVAKAIELDLANSEGEFLPRLASWNLPAFGRPQDKAQHLHPDRVPGEDGVLVSASPSSKQTPFQLTAENVTRLEWYNAIVSCPESCLSGGGPSVTTTPELAGFRATSEQHSYEILEGTSLAVTGQGTLDHAMFGSTNLSMELAGSIRLPFSNGDTSACPSCLSPENQTFAAEGTLSLAGMQMVSEGMLQANVAGDIRRVRFDETDIDPSLIRGPATALVGVAATAGLAILFKLLSPLFTRHKEDSPLDNERRRRLYDHVVQNPGVHFREALRAVGIPAGSGRHHVTQLVRAGLLVEHRHHSKMRLFENKPNFVTSWKGLAALRNPMLRELHAWIDEHPGSSQKDILAAFQAAGWSPSTTKSRLDRLVRQGMLGFRLRGRYKLYSVAVPH